MCNIVTRKGDSHPGISVTWDTQKLCCYVNNFIRGLCITTVMNSICRDCNSAMVFMLFAKAFGNGLHFGMLAMGLHTCMFSIDFSAASFNRVTISSAVFLSFTGTSGKKKFNCTTGHNEGDKERNWPIMCT